MGPLGAMNRIRHKFILSSSKIFINQVYFFYFGFGSKMDIIEASITRAQEYGMLRGQVKMYAT